MACTISAISRISRSNRPNVLGFVSMRAAVWGESLDSRSARLIRPSGPERTSTTRKPLRAALAGFVPCAESGTSTSVRFSSRERWKAAIIRSAVHSPCAPAAGWRVTRSTPTTAHNACSSRHISSSAPWMLSSSWYG